MRSLSIVRSDEPHVHVVVEDIANPDIVDDTRREIAAAFSASGATGSWVVAVVASDTRGRWDVGVRGPHGSHFFSFSASPAHVPEIAARYVKRALSAPDQR